MQSFSEPLYFNMKENVFTVIIHRQKTCDGIQTFLHHLLNRCLSAISHKTVTNGEQNALNLLAPSNILYFCKHSFFILPLKTNKVHFHGAFIIRHNPLKFNFAQDANNIHIFHRNKTMSIIIQSNIFIDISILRLLYFNSNIP